MTSKKVAELSASLQPENAAKWVTSLWDTYNNQRMVKIQEWTELRNFVFATDTTTTTVGALPWQNTTTIPKLCQIRDNLHSNYISSLFPNDDWLKWVAYSQDAAVKTKADTIKTYMDNKCREGHFRTETSKLLYDYIDYGNAFATVSFESTYKENEDGTLIPDYIGPRVHRISPLDIVFNPLASTFKDSFKIVRSIKSVGELQALAATDPDQAYWNKALDRREEIVKSAGGYHKEDFDKAIGYSMDGFGSMYEYFTGQYVEILEFFGDFYNEITGEMECNKVVTVADRQTVVRTEDIPSWFGHAPIYHVGWRFRPDNLWAMGPLDNLVGMQYRIDHLNNLKADAMDLVVHPPLKIIGEVEAFTWAPKQEIHIDEGGSDVQPMSVDLQGIIAAGQEIIQLEDRMELYAGAPREAMGIRTPGEKTATEVTQLQNAAGRIFQEKITQYEVELLEPILNAMLEVSKRLMDGYDVLRVMDDTLGVEQFVNITKSDITASGKLRPVGARHYAKQAQDLQNLIGVANSPLWQSVLPDLQRSSLTKLIEDVTGLSGYNLFKPNAAIFEAQESNRLANQAQEDLQVEQTLPAGPGAVL